MWSKRADGGRCAKDAVSRPKREASPLPACSGRRYTAQRHDHPGTASEHQHHTNTDATRLQHGRGHGSRGLHPPSGPGAAQRRLYGAPTGSHPLRRLAEAGPRGAVLLDADLDHGGVRAAGGAAHQPDSRRARLDESQSSGWSGSDRTRRDVRHARPRRRHPTHRSADQPAATLGAASDTRGLRARLGGSRKFSARRRAGPGRCGVARPDVRIDRDAQRRAHRVDRHRGAAERIRRRDGRTAVCRADTAAPDTR